MNTLLALSEIPFADMLAAVGTNTNQTDAQAFFDKGIGLIIQNIFWVVGVIVVVVTIARAVKAFAGGKMGTVAKDLIGGLIAAVICFDLGLPFQLIGGATSVVSAVIQTITDAIS